MGSIKRKIVGNKVYTYNGNKLIHVTDRGTGTGTGTNYDITKTTKQQNNTVKNTNKNNKNADGTWKSQTMVTGSYFGAQSNQQQNKQQTQAKPKTTTPVVQAPQIKQTQVSNKKNTNMRERIADKNKGKVAVAGKGLVDRGAESKSYKVTTPNVKALQEAYVQKNGQMTEAKRMTPEVYAKIRNIQKVQQGVNIKDVTNANTQKYLTDLANKETINDVDKREIQNAISRIDEWGRSNFFNYSDPETRASLQTLRAKLDARANAGTSVGAGMVDAMVPGLDYIKENADKSIKETTKGTAYGKGVYKNGDPNIDYQKANPVAYGVGQTIGNLVLMEVAASGVGSGVTKGLSAAAKAGKISAKAAKWIGIGARNTGLAAVMTTKDATKKGYDWDNYGADFLKSAIMFNAMGYSSEGISAALGSLLKAGGKTFSNAWQTGRKLATAAGSAGVGVASTIPLNTKEENENLINQWITLTAFQAVPSILGGIESGKARGEAAAEGIKSAGSDLKQAEAIYKEAIMAENRGDLETAKMLYDRANATTRQVAELIYSPESEGLYGLKQSDKELLKDALDWIVNNSNFEANTGVDFSTSAGPALPGGTPLQLTEGAKLLPGEVNQPDIPTPTLDQYAGGKAVVDAIIGRPTAPADTMPTIAKYGGAEIASQAAIAANPKSVSPVRAAADVPMISKYSGSENVADEASVAIVSGKIRPQVQEALKQADGEVTINDKGNEITLPTNESLDLDLITRQEADGTIDTATFNKKYEQIVDTGRLINGIINTEGNDLAPISVSEEIAKWPAEIQADLQIIANDFSKGIIDETDVITQIQDITKIVLPAETGNDIISEINGGDGYVKGFKYDSNTQSEGSQGIDGISYRPAGRYAGRSIRELYQSPGKEKAFTRTAEYRRASSEIRGTLLYKDKLGNTIKEHYSQVPERFYDGEMNAIVTQNSRVGLETVFVYNNLKINGRICLAATDGKKVFLSMKSDNYTLTALNRHEVGHDFIDDNPDLKSLIKNRIIDLVGQETYDEQLQLYKVDELAGYDFTSEDAETEFLCDSLAEVTVLSEAEGFQTIVDEFNKLIDNETKTSNITGKISTKLSKKQIEDFGEKIGGARKDVWIKRGLSVEDLDPMNAAEANKYVKKDYVWKKPKYDTMLEEGADKELLFYKKLVRDAIPTTPAYSYLDRAPEQLRAKQEAYIDTVKTIKNWIDNLDDIAEAKDAVHKLLVDKGYITSDKYGYHYTLTEKANGGAITNKLFDALRIVDNPERFARKIVESQFGVPKDQKIPAGMSVGYNNQNNTWYVSKGRRGYRKIVARDLTSKEEAIRIAQETAKGGRAGGKQRFIPPQFERLRRSGIDYRNGNHATGQDYLDDFDFRGGEFGNWMSEADRQASLDYGYDALSDLADVLGISKNDVSFKKWLAIAFGARGKGSAAAHFEPERRVINLTKMKGAGSLGHEWAHGLSTWLGEMFGNSNEAITDHARDYEPMQKVIDAMLYRAPSESEIKEFAETISKRKSDRTEHFRAYMSRYFPADKMSDAQKAQYDDIMDRLTGLGQDDAYALATGNEMFDYKGGALGELSDLRKAAFGRVLGKELRKEIYNYVYNIARQGEVSAPTRTESNYLKNSRAFGKAYGSQGVGYWDSPEEMLARAFACYLTDSLKAKGMVNDYLSGHSEAASGMDFDMHPIKAIPEGEERIAINKAIGELIADLKDRGIFTAAEPSGDIVDTIYKDQARAFVEELRAEEAKAAEEKPTETVSKEPAQLTAADAKQKAANLIDRILEIVDNEQQTLTGVQQEVVDAVNGVKQPTEISPEALNIFQNLTDEQKKKISFYTNIEEASGNITVNDDTEERRAALDQFIKEHNAKLRGEPVQTVETAQQKAVNETPTAEEFQQAVNEAANEPAPVVTVETEEVPAVERPQLKSKLSKQYDKAVKEFTDNAFNLMNISGNKSVQTKLRAEIERIAANTFETGMVDNDAVTDLVARMWDAGQISENYIMDNFPELKEYFRKTAIKVSDAIQRDITDYNAWRKSQMGSLNITHKTGTPVDVIYQELNARYPELFPEDIINPTEQLMRMADIRQQMRGTTRSNSNLYTDEQRVEIASMANKLVDTLEKKLVGIAAESKGEAIPGYSPENLASLDAQDPLNQDPDWLSLQQTEPVAETEGEKLKNYKETRRRVNLTSQVLDMTRRVQKAAKKAQPELRAKMIEEFGTIVPYFKGMSDGKRINLKKQIDDLDRFRREVPGAKQYVWDSAAGTYKEDDPIMKIMNQLNGKLIAEMTNDELYQLFKNGQMMLHQLQTAKKEIREQGAREISDLSDNLVKQMKTAGPKAVKDNSVADFFTVKMLRPETFAKEVDGYAEDGVMQRLVEDIREGQTKAIDFKNRANDLFEDFTDRNKKLIEKEWAGKKAKWHDTGVVPINGSETIKLTPGLRIAVYLNSLDYDAMRHMVGGQYRGDDGKMHVYDGGGITVPDQKLWEKGKYEEAKAAGKNYKVTEKMVERIIDTMTPEEKEWADIAFKEYYNGMSPAEGNKTSLAIDGWERFIKKNYYRIITDENYTQTVFDSLINDSTIEGQGMLKERVKGAHNPILLVDAFEALDSHIDGMSKYVGLAAPIRNFMKVYNYNDGDVSVKAALNERMGLAGKNYIKKYITDLQGGGKKSGDGRVMSKIRSGYAGSTLTLNPGVVFMQSASLPTAASYLGFGNVIKGLARKVDAETVKKYSVYYRYRSKGNYTADFDDLTKNKTMLDKMPLFNWIQQMDNATVRKLWGACECYVEEHFPDLKKGSEEYLVQVGKTLDKCVSLTQPNYTTAERPEILRSDNELVKSLTMFKTQPLQNFNLVLEAVRNVFFKAKAYRNARKEGRTGRKEKEELKNARKGLAQTIGAVTVAAVMIAAIRGASEMLKGRWENFVDENGEFSLEGLFNYMGKETGGSLAGSVIGGNELYSFISSMIDENSNYYDVSAPQLSVINDFTTAIKNVYDVFSAVSTGDKSPKALFRSAEKLAETIATMFGIPVANARKYVCGIIGNFFPEFKAEYEDLMYGVDLGDVKNASGEGWGSWLFGGMADTDAYFNKYFENRNGTGIKTEYRDEIKRLLTDYKEITGDVNGMFLSDPDKYTYNGITYELKQDDKDAIRQIAQAEASENINKLMSMRAFEGLTDEQKIKAIKEINSLAAENAKNQWLSDHNQSVDKGKDFNKVCYALFKASVNDDMTSAEKKQKLLDLNFSDYATASVYEKYFETKSTKEENSIAYKMEHTSKSAAEIIRESLQEKAEKEKSAKESVVNESTTKIKEAEGYTLPNFRASTLQAIADIGISPEDYAYVSDRLDGHDDKVDYINSLPFDKKTKQGLVDDLVMGDKAHDKMKVAEEDYNIPNSTYIDTYMFGYESTGSKKERNQKIQDYVNDLPGLNDSQKDYLYWANQVYRKKEAVGGGESGSYSGSESGKSSSGGRRSGRRRSSGGGSSGGSGGSTSSAATIPEAQGYTVPKYRKDKLAKISDMGLTAADYAYVTDRVASTDNKVGYIKSLGLSSKATQGLISDLVMDATGRRKMTVGAQDYGIPTETYTQAYMYAYETTGSKAERNEKIKAYVNAISGLDSKQKTYLTWAVQANRSNGASESGSSGSSGNSSSSVSVKAAPSVSRKSVSNIAKSSISKYIASNLNSKAQAQKNADYAAQVKSIDNNVFMTAKQKAAAKKRLQNAFGK